MGRILIMAQPASLGHFSPFVGPVQWLGRMGHEVGWVCMNDHRAAQVRRLGIDVLRTRGDVPLALFGLDWMREGGPDAVYIDAYRKQFVESVPTSLELARPVIAEYEPDLMICDALNFAAHIAAQIGGIPYVGLDTNLFTLGCGPVDSRFTRLIPQIFPARDEMFRRYGARSEFGFLEAIAPKLNIVLTTRALVGADVALSPSTLLAGPSLPIEPLALAPDFPIEQLSSDLPIVYMSLGTLFWRHRPALFATVAEATSDLDVQVVISAGDFAESAEARSFGEHVRIFKFVPQLELLKRSSLFITHGGANSIMEGLYFGVPMLVVPVDFDQPLNGYHVERSGAGLSIAADRLTVESCRNALTEMIGAQSPYRRAAASIRTDYRSHDGARTTAERVARALGG
jgi:zeaxanthin glucosyltransferase